MAQRWAVMLAFCALAACGEDTPLGAGAGSASGDSPTDAQVVNGVDVPDVVDAAVDATGLPAWLTGTWLECSGTLTITQPDQAVWQASGNSCRVTASLAWHDGALDFLTVTGTGCSGPLPTWLIPGTHASSDGNQLTLVAPSLFAGLKRFAAHATRELWAVKSSNGGSGNLRLCFDASGQFYDGGWTSADCSLIACGSLVAQVKHVGTETHIWTECQGSCPCTSILIAAEKTAAAMAGKYSSASCLHAEDGTFSATPQAFP